MQSLNPTSVGGGWNSVDEAGFNKGLHKDLIMKGRRGGTFSWFDLGKQGPLPPKKKKEKKERKKTTCLELLLLSNFTTHYYILYDIDYTKTTTG